MKKNKKKTQADLFRELSVPEHLIRAGGLKRSMRYTSPLEKGIYWYHFSIFVRERDIKEWGVCISCGDPITMENSNAGHFMPAANCGRDMLFDERNVNAECARCNAFDEGHLVGYAKSLNDRYGNGTAERLWARREEYRKSTVPLKDWSRHEYAAMTIRLLEQIRHMRQSQGVANPQMSKGASYRVKGLDSSIKSSLSID